MRVSLRSQRCPATVNDAEHCRALSALKKWEKNGVAKLAAIEISMATQQRKARIPTRAIAPDDAMGDELDAYMDDHEMTPSGDEPTPEAGAAPSDRSASHVEAPSDRSAAPPSP